MIDVIRSRRVASWVFVALMGPVPLAFAQPANEPLSRKEQLTLSSETFLDAHPDMKHRRLGWEAYTAGDAARARAEFLKAAWYGDKPSQAMLAEMDWKGEGAPMDRASAYTWADIAAERGYAVFVTVRERYWKSLDATEQAQALQDGPARMAEYGDDVARERLDRHLKRRLRDIKWSARTVGPPREVRLYDNHGHEKRIDGSRFFSPTFWDPEKYRAWQDMQWKAPPKGKVDVGDVEQVKPPEGG